MKQKQKIVVAGAVGIIFLLFWCAIIILVIKNLRESSKSEDSPVTDVTLCDEDASDLCVINFGANSLNRMVISFKLPHAGYAPFYVKATNRGTVSVYMCEVDEAKVLDEPKVDKSELDGTKVVGTETVEAAPTSVHCTGVRTPLGETIDIEVYTTDEDKLIARGTFLVSAIALATPISLPTETPMEEFPTEIPVPTEPPITEAPFITEEPFVEEEPTPLPEDALTPDTTSSDP